MIFNRYTNLLRKFASIIPSWSWTLLKGLISIGLIVWLILDFDWNEVAVTLARVSWLVIAGWLVIWAVAYCLMGLRLKVLLAAQKIEVDLFYSIQLVFIGAFTGNFMPSSMGGDAFKFVYLARAGYGKSITGASIVLDRLLNILAVFMFLPFALALPGLINVDLLTENARLYWVIGIIILGGVLVVTGAIAALRVRKLPLPLPSNRTLSARLRRIIHRMVEIAVQWLDHPCALILAMALSFVAISLCFVGGWVVAQGIGIEISLESWLAIQACLSVLVFLPISLNGLGLQEVSLVYFMSLVGVSEGKSQALALLLRVLIVLFSLFGVFGLIAEKRKISKPDGNESERLSTSIEPGDFS